MSIQQAADWWEQHLRKGIPLPAECEYCRNAATVKGMLPETLERHFDECFFNEEK